MAKAATKKTGFVTALEFLAVPDKYPVKGACAVYGDEEYLKSEVLTALRRQLLGADDAEFALTTFEGKEAQLREVSDALGTNSLFGGGGSVVIVEEADAFVTQYRPQLEDLVAKSPAGRVLVLDVKTLPVNTRLAKAIAANGLAIECKSVESYETRDRAAKERELKKWLSQRAKSVHNARFDEPAVNALFELVPPEPGVLVQELDKLAIISGKDSVIDVKLVCENVGGWRARAAWDMVDAAADGRAAEALAQLDRLIASGEKPHGLLPQMASSLRRFSTAMQLIEMAEAERRRITPREALAQAGVLPFKVNDAERQLRQIGRGRARRLTEWLLAADLAIKGHNSSDDRARTEIERLIVRLSASAARAAAT
jgi:DNA polymerase-3 subunit delta